MKLLRFRTQALLGEAGGGGEEQGSGADLTPPL